MELPIFRELESAWFRTGRSVRPPGVPGGGGAEAGGAQAAEFATVSARSKAARGRPDAPAGTTDGDAAAGEATSGESAPEGAGAGTVPTEGWQTAADDGWRAASSAAEAVVQETTAAGLPKRQPMAQLVPGGVEREQASAQHRSPDAVRGLLSAYHRGVQRGREQTTDQDGDPSNGSPSTPAGKERRT
jgi:hypothetical protein